MRWASAGHVHIISNPRCTWKYIKVKVKRVDGVQMSSCRKHPDVSGRGVPDNWDCGAWYQGHVLLDSRGTSVGFLIQAFSLVFFFLLAVLDLCFCMGVFSSSGARTSHYGAFSSCGAQALGRSGFSTWGAGALVAPQHIGTPQTKDQTHVPWISRQTPNHWTTREVPLFGLLDSAKYHPLIALSPIPTSPPKYPQFFWPVTIKLQDSTEPDRGDSWPFLWNHIQALLETTKSQKWKKKKKTPAEFQHSIETLHSENFLFT